MATHTASKDREPLSGLVERVTYHSPETGFCVLRVKVRGHRELVTVTGSAASIQPGEFVQASGRWDNHRDHGIQFKTTFLKVMPPNSLDGIEKYLGSGMIKTADQIAAKLGIEKTAMIRARAGISYTADRSRHRGALWVARG